HACRHGGHREGDAAEPDSVAEELEVELLPGLQPKPFEYGQIARQAERERGKNEVEAHREGELEPSEQESVRAVEHGSTLARSRANGRRRAPNPTGLRKPVATGQERPYTPDRTKEQSAHP